MADDDRKDDAEDASEAKKTPTAEAARARTKTARSAAAKPTAPRRPAAADSGVKPGPGPESDTSGDKSEDKSEDGGAPDAATETEPGAGFKLPQSTGALAAAFGAVILILIVLAWPAGRGYIAGLFSGPKDAARAELTKRLVALEASLARIEKDLAALKTGGDARADLEKRVTALESRPGAAQFDQKLEQSEKRMSGLKATVEALDARLAKTEAAQSTSAVALMALAGALRTGAPFAELSERVTAEVGGKGEAAAALKPLALFAETGVPTVDALMARLDSLEVPAEKAPAPEAAPKAAPAKPQGFWDKVKANVMKLGRIRKSPQKPVQAPAVVTVRAATAEALLRGDLIAAAEAAKALPGTEAANWRRDLEARIKANAAAAALDHLTAVRLGRPKGQK